MVEVALILLTCGAVSLGCLHSWCHLRRVGEAGHGDRAARERVVAHYRRSLHRPGESPLQGDAGMNDDGHAQWN
jgi:hypothetical protein